MPTFPLHFRPAYNAPPRSFGSARDHGARKHAGCDLFAPPGSAVLACLDGRVIRGPYLFYDVVYALEVQHADGSVIRYGEIAQRGQYGSAALFDDEVKEGQVIAYVGRMQSVKESMLHFEMYAGKHPLSFVPGEMQHISNGPLTDVSRLPFKRRADLIDPTQFLDSCTLAVAAT